MKKIKKLLTIGLTVLLMLCVSISLFGCKKRQEIVCGDFVCLPRDKYITVCSLSENGREKEIVIIPPYLDGKLVNNLGTTYYYAASSRIRSNVMKDLYVSYSVLSITAHAPPFIQSDSLERAFWCGNQGFMKNQGEYYADYTFHLDNVRYYVTNVCYEYLVNKKFRSFLYKEVFPANTAYMFNYENCPNDGYFFINDFEYGATIENTPYEPIRDGYVFGGWYKESECINAWNFETDTLPQAQYGEQEREIYQETKLYAKWIKE